MKALKYILGAVLLITFVWSCTDDNFGSTDFVSTPVKPTNITALYNVSQDNTGLVTITPNGEGAVSYDIYLGDDTTEAVKVNQGENTSHIYAEGTYDVKIIAFGITGLKTEITQELVVSFKAPQNLEVLLANDLAISKQVNVTANAEFATSFEVYFGEEGNDEPVTANIGNTASYVYAEPGTYTIRVVALGAAIETTEYTVDFEVTAILQPIASAPTPVSRKETDVISIYGDAYTNLANINYNPDWGQSGQGSSFAEFDLNGDQMLNYINLSYQGIDFGQEIDVSGMEFLHLDVWTADAESIEVSAIRPGPDERPITIDLVANEWNSIEIPLSNYTDQGLTLSDLFQLKLVGSPWAAGTVFIDNIYFYKAPTGISSTKIEDFEGTAPTFTDFGNIEATTVIANPDNSGLNTTNNVAQFTKTANAETWAGTFFGPSNAIDLVNYSNINLKTWSPKIGAVVKVKLENADASTVYEIDAVTTKSNSWEDLTFDFSKAPSADYVNFVIFFDFGNVGDGATYYFDEISLSTQGGNTGGAPYNPIDFEAGGFGADWTWTVFENDTNPPVEIVANPDATGINTSSTVAKITALTGGQPWVGCESLHGSDIGSFSFDATNSIVKIMVYKTVISDVGLKFAEASGDAQTEIKVANTLVNEWEELTFDLSGSIGQGATGIIDQIIIFPDFDMSGRTSDNVVYFDNITFGSN